MTPTKRMTPTSAFKRGKTLHSEARAIVSNVTNFFKEEASAKALKYPISQATKRAAKATRLSESTIKKIKREVKALNKSGSDILSTPGKHRKRPENRNCRIDDFDKCVIRQVIQDFYIHKKKVPSISKLLPVLQQKINFKWQRESLRQILHSMNFRWKKCSSRREILMERPDIVFWRNRYLREMKKHRSNNRCIVYIDETWIDSNLTFGKCWQDDKMTGVKVDINSKNRLIVVHAGSSNGFIDGAELVYKASTTVGDYHGQMNFQNFEKWTLEKLIPSLPPNSVICMDNAPYHTKKVDPVPTKYATKTVMVDWLLQKGLAHDPTMRKAELYDIISKNAPKSATYRIDSLLKQEGHEVVRLPPYHCDLNAIEYVWSSVKRFIRENNVDGDLSLEKLKVLLSQAFTKVTANEWASYCKCVVKKENEYWERDGLTEDVVDKLIIEVGESSDSETDSALSGGSESDFEDIRPLD